MTLSRGFSPHSAAGCCGCSRRAVRFSVVNRQYNTEKPELQGDSRPSRFSPVEWLSIHRRLFEGVFSHAGQVRQYNITKKEWVLNGDTVTYADWNSIKDTLDYDFATEKQFS